MFRSAGLSVAKRIRGRVLEEGGKVRSRMGGPKRKEEERPLSTAQGASSLIPSEGSNCFYSPDLTGSDFHFQQICAYPRHARYPQASLGASIVPDGSGLVVDPWSIRGKS